MDLTQVFFIGLISGFIFGLLSKDKPKKSDRDDRFYF